MAETSGERRQSTERREQRVVGSGQTAIRLSHGEALTVRPLRHFRKQQAAQGIIPRARVAAASVVMGRQNWRILYRSIVETIDADPSAAQRLLDDVYVEQTSSQEAARG